MDVCSYVRVFLSFTALWPSDAFGADILLALFHWINVLLPVSHQAITRIIALTILQ